MTYFKSLKKVLLILFFPLILSFPVNSFAVPADVCICFTPGGNCANQIIDQINQEKSSILVQAYQLTSEDIQAALVNAQQRGIPVKIILDKTQYTTKRLSPAVFFDNMGIPVWIDYRPAIAHNKIIILSSLNTVITGSYNYSQGAQKRNAENLLIIKSPEITQIYTQNFQNRLNVSLRLADYEVYKKNKSPRKR